MLFNVMNDNRNKDTPIDINSPELHAQIKKKAAAIAADVAIANLNSNPLHYQYYISPEAREKIITRYWQEKIRLKRSADTRVKAVIRVLARTIGQMFQAIFKEITKPSQ